MKNQVLFYLKSLLDFLNMPGNNGIIKTFKIAIKTNVQRKPIESDNNPLIGRPTPVPILAIAINIANIDAAMCKLVFCIDMAK